MIVRGERARVLQRQGLVLNGLSDIKARPTVIDDPHKLRETGTLIIATKAIDSMQALETLRHVRVDNAFSVQNGVLKNELLARVTDFRACSAPWRTSAANCSQWRSEVHAQCLPAHRRGEGRQQPARRRAGAAIDGAGVRCARPSNIRTREWSKYAGWIAQFPLAVLTRQITWKFLMDERSALVIVRIVREAAQLAAGHEDRAQPTCRRCRYRASCTPATRRRCRIIRGIGQKFLDTSPEHRMSAQQDVLRGSRLEYEETLGYALAKGRELGVPMPTLDTCYRIISVAHPCASRERSHFSLRKMGLYPSATAVTCCHSPPRAPNFPDDFESHRRRAPARPGKKKPTTSGAVIVVDPPTLQRQTSLVSRRAAPHTAAATSPST
jgi:2-dehydropantoate 2-reductase